VHAALLRPVQVLHRHMVSAAQQGSPSTVVLCVGHGSPAASWLAGGIGAVVVFARFGHTLRFYIRPHFVKCPPALR
jgi:hypothetical protein